MSEYLEGFLAGIGACVVALTARRWIRRNVAVDWARRDG